MFQSQDQALCTTRIQISEPKLSGFHRSPTVGQLADTEVVERESKSSLQRLGARTRPLAFLVFGSDALVVERTEQFVDRVEEPIVPVLLSCPVPHRHVLEADGVATSETTATASRSCTAPTSSAEDGHVTVRTPCMVWWMLQWNL